jgi:putative intracellular protease/amidase
MRDDAAYRTPIPWRDIEARQFDGLVLTGGHASGMLQYLESSLLQQKIVEFWKLNRPVSAICHGTLLLARCIDPDTDRSVLHGRKTCTLPKVAH